MNGAFCLKMKTETTADARKKPSAAKNTMDAHGFGGVSLVKMVIRNPIAATDRSTTVLSVSMRVPSHA